MEGAEDAGQPVEHGMVHMAMYWAWILRRGWFEPEFVTDDELERLRRHLPGSAVHAMDTSDGKLVSEPMSEEAVAFSDYYYDRYLRDWAAEFKDFPAYGVPDTQANQQRAERMIERRYEEWLRRGRSASWRPSIADRLRAAARAIFPYAILMGAIVAVAGVSAALELRGFPWPFVQLGVVVVVLFLVIRHQISSE